jgi:hypothetical protein
MMQRVLQLLGAGDLAGGGTDVRLEWAYPIPAWGWAPIVAAAFAIALWGYVRLEGSRIGRFTLATLRALLLLLLVVALSGPQLVRRPETVQRDAVVVMLDRSASMSVSDTDATRTREDELRAAITAATPTWQALSKDHDLLWMGFDSGVADLGEGAGVPTLAEPDGRRTQIAAALEQAWRRVGTRPVSGIVMLSDGRTTDAPGKSLVRQLTAKQVPVFTVPLGSATSRLDLAVARVQTPTAAFVDDQVPVSVELTRHGGLESDSWPAGSVELVDTATGAVLDTAPLPAGVEPNQRVTLTTRPRTVGDAAWRVRIVTPGPADPSPVNDSADVRLSLVDRKLRVAYFDGTPRWEYRYLKNLLLRETSIRSSTMLLSSDKRFIQEGSEVMLSVPRTPEEWRGIDVVIMGDVRSELFSTPQLEALRDHVSKSGAGLLWIGGPGATPMSWRGTPLADLLPMRLSAGSSSEDDGESSLRAWTEPIVVAPTAVATRMGVMRLTESAGADPLDFWPASLSNPGLGWSQLKWAQVIDPARLKPAAEILAEARGVNTSKTLPLVITMRYGSGRSVYVGTDETWRWRYARGEQLPERFWIPIVRMLARERLALADKPAALSVAPQQPSTQQPVQISVQLLDQSILQTRPEGVRVRVSPLEARKGEQNTELVLRAAPGNAEAGNTFGAQWVPLEPGPYRIDVIDPLLAGANLSARVDVRSTDDERNNPQADHALLEALAKDTGGQVLTPARLSDLQTLLLNRELRMPGTPEIRTLWDNPAVLALLISLVALEWIGRRLMRMP